MINNSLLDLMKAISRHKRKISKVKIIIISHLIQIIVTEWVMFFKLKFIFWVGEVYLDKSPIFINIIFLSQFLGNNRTLQANMEIFNEGEEVESLGKLSLIHFINKYLGINRVRALDDGDHRFSSEGSK